MSRVPYILAIDLFTEKDEKTKVFYDAYQRDVQNEGENDFAHLASDDWNNEDEGDDEEEPETVTTAEIQQRLREVARQNKSGEAVSCSNVY